jgi:hypothetical protein
MINGNNHRFPDWCICFSSLHHRFREFAKDERGNIAIMASIILPVMIGAMGLGVEMSYRYFQQRKVHNAADVAAHGAGVRLAFGDPQSVYSDVGRQLAIDASWDQSGTYLLNSPPQNGPYAGTARGPNGGTLIEAVLSEVQPRIFSRLWNQSDMTVSAYSVAEVLQKRDACILALDPTAARAVEFSGGASLTLSGCEIASNSDASDAVYQGGTSIVQADCINTVGLVNESGGITLTDPECPSPRENQAVTADPYSDVPEPAIEGPCENWNTLTHGSPHHRKYINASYNHSSGVLSMRFCSNTVDMKQRIEFGPGLYILDGVNMTVNANADVRGSEVMFYLVNGASLQINGSGEVNLAAMTSGDWSPILFFVSRNNTATSHQLNGNSFSSFEGVIYVPNGELDYSGGSALAEACTQVIAKAVTFTGASDFKSDCSDFPFKEIVVSSLVQLID